MKLILNKNNIIDRDDNFKNLLFGYLGDGIIIWDKTRYADNHFDYLKLAHIDAYRNVKYFTTMPEDIADYIKHYAKTANPITSTVNSKPVFNTYYYEKYKSRS